MPIPQATNHLNNLQPQTDIGCLSPSLSLEAKTPFTISISPLRFLLRCEIRDKNKKGLISLKPKSDFFTGL